MLDALEFSLKTAIQASIIGILITLLLLAMAFGVDYLGYPKVSTALFWQNALLQSLCPTFNIGTPDHPVYEGTPLNFLAFIASIPLGFIIYGIPAYVILRSRLPDEKLTH